MKTGGISRNLVIIVLVCSGGMLACSNARQKPEINARFVTQIDAQGSKQFQLVMQHEPPSGRSGKSMRREPPPGGGGPGGPPGGRGGHDNFAERELQREEEMRERLHRLLAEKINESSYCREGYDVTDEQIAFALQPSIRGVCREKATEQDRLAFATESESERPLVIYEDLGAE